MVRKKNSYFSTTRDKFQIFFTYLNVRGFLIFFIWMSESIFFSICRLLLSDLCIVYMYVYNVLSRWNNLRRYFQLGPFLQRTNQIIAPQRFYLKYTPPKNVRGGLFLAWNQSNQKISIHPCHTRNFDCFSWGWNKKNPKWLTQKTEFFNSPNFEYFLWQF